MGAGGRTLNVIMIRCMRNMYGPMDQVKNKKVLRIVKKKVLRIDPSQVGQSQLTNQLRECDDILGMWRKNGRDQ